MTPYQAYTKKLEQKLIRKDPLQKEVVLAFDTLYSSLTSKRKKWFFESDKQIKGLYIYGSVGRGKTFLMDLFVESINPAIIKRQHYHSFMLWLHQQLHKIKKQQNPIDLIIKELSQDISVLCLDEFLVNDITDAMLLATLLKALEKHKICLVTTSNVNPINLYTGGLQRKKFLPAIAWMQQQLNIIELDGNFDYRSCHHSPSKKWLSPITSSNSDIFYQDFENLTHNNYVTNHTLEINKRAMKSKQLGDAFAMFAFDTLCSEPRNADDYLKLCELFEGIFIIINNKIDDEDRNTARRFITLIDVLYDNKTELYVLSEVDFNSIYKGEELAFEMKRTISRLTEMQ